MRKTRLSLLICSIIIHFFIAKIYIFKTFNHYAYDYLIVFYVIFLATGAIIFLKKSLFIDMIFSIVTPYISSVITFFYVTIKTSPYIVINNLWPSIIIGSVLPYIALYAWFLSVILIIERLGMHYICNDR